MIPLVPEVAKLHALIAVQLVQKEVLKGQEEVEEVILELLTAAAANAEIAVLLLV